MNTILRLLSTFIFTVLTISVFSQIRNTIRLEAENYNNVQNTLRIPLNGKEKTIGVSSSLSDDASHIDFTFTLPDSGLYTIHSFALTDTYGSKLMEAAKTKFESLFMDIQVNEQAKSKRVVVVPWNVPKQELGKFTLRNKNSLKLWIPKGVVLDYIEISKYNPPIVPDRVSNYTPKYVPKGHPRLWVNKNTIQSVRENLELAENKVRWGLVSSLAFKKVSLPTQEGELYYDENVEKVIEAKAFYYLITQDVKIGQEATDLVKAYISRVSFGNILDITREIGRAIHITSEVYDWCYDLMSQEDLSFIRKHLKRLAMDMEIGWPPFLQTVVNGHGSEAQVARDLLSMAIAIYDEDPIPYQFCSYLVLEELVPMRQFEYQSPRHNQGINYGAYRINWDLHAAWLFKRMLGQEVFGPNIKNMVDYWLYFRLPDGQMLRDGDHSFRNTPDAYSYWQINPTSFFMLYTYSRNPYLKDSFERMNTTSVNPVLFLLLNDPTFKSSPIPADYPLNKDFGPILGGMVNRTGWDDSLQSNNVIAEIKGGGYFFSNHQHNDAGAIQIYHRGFQVVDLGQYKFYGTPYDLNFTKRSVAHSMMLAIDSTEKIGNIPSNDGGTRMYRKVPNSMEEVTNNQAYANGKVISSSLGSKFNYFSVNLTSAYSPKIEDYLRDYIFINTYKEDIPAIIILRDKMETTSADIKKYWQINTLQQPSFTKDNQIKLTSARGGIEANTYIKHLALDGQVLNREVLSGDDAHNIFGFQVFPPNKEELESFGHRILLSPKQSNKKDKFLTVFQMANFDAGPMPIQYAKEESYDRIIIDNMLIILMNSRELKEANIKFEIKDHVINEVLLAGLEDGKWLLFNSKNKSYREFIVDENKNTSTFNLEKGLYQLKKKLE